MTRVWLVTGSAGGLGRNIAEAVLASGYRLVATARDPRFLEDLVKKYGDRVRTTALDVADEGVAKAAVQVAMDAFGRLDVVVNNAGYGDVAPFEQLSSERFKAVVDTNFYGVVNVTRAALPIMRKQKSGCILQISSLGGRLALPGTRRTTLPSGLSEDSPSRSPKKWHPLASRCVRSNPAGCGQTGAFVRTKTYLNCFPIMNRPLAR
jgi:NAD(P)-dependent dehydrogenase (short-subunit alcohol dehydrogenase family)